MAHSLHCPASCHRHFCKSLTRPALKIGYAARFNFQSLLTRQFSSSGTTDLDQLLQHWREALAILREAEDLKWLDLDQLRFYSTCSDNPIFNNPHSAVLSAAVDDYLGPNYIALKIKNGRDFKPENHYQVHPPTFWVALSACVVGDLQLFELYLNKLTQATEASSNLQPVHQLITRQPTALLIVAIKHGRLQIIRRLLSKYPNIISSDSENTSTNCLPLQSAIFSNNDEVLELLLGHTPNEPELLAQALRTYHTLLMLPPSGAKTVRLLTEHFTPLSVKARKWLILHSCPVGDVTLLEDFSKTAPIFGPRHFELGGRIPSYLNFAIRYSNIELLRFLLDHGAVEAHNSSRLSRAAELALAFNKPDCYRELYKRYEHRLRHQTFFQYLSWAENVEDLMLNQLSRHRNELFRQMGPTDAKKPSIAQKALSNAIQRLRHENVRFLLKEGIQLFPWPKHEDPLQIKWPFYDQNREAFRRTQEVLDAFDLPQLQISV